MIILPDRKVIVVATPRTGSRSIKQAILAASPPNLIVTGAHHDWPHEVGRAAANGGYSVYTMIRNPWGQLKSWLTHTGQWHNQEEFVRNYRSRYFFYAGGMNIYNEVATRYFVFEDGGHQQMLDALGIDEELPWVGQSTDPKMYQTVLSEESRELARRRFVNDFHLYQQITEGG